MKKKIIRNTMAIVSAAVILTFLAVTFLMYTHSVKLLKFGTENEAETLKAAIDAEGMDFMEMKHFLKTAAGSRLLTGMAMFCMIRRPMPALWGIIRNARKYLRHFISQQGRLFGIRIHWIKRFTIMR